MSTVVINLLSLLGALFTLVAAIGMVRFPDVLWRMHAAAKAGTLGAGLLLAAVAVTAPASASSRAIAAILFVVLTAPIATHVLARGVLRAESGQKAKRRSNEVLRETVYLGPVSSTEEQKVT